MCPPCSNDGSRAYAKASVRALQNVPLMCCIKVYLCRLVETLLKVVCCGQCLGSLGCRATVFAFTSSTTGRRGSHEGACCAMQEKFCSTR
eukprot:6458906-Amphidinium_carterae.2